MLASTVFSSNRGVARSSAARPIPFPMQTLLLTSGEPATQRTPASLFWLHLLASTETAAVELTKIPCCRLPTHELLTTVACACSTTPIPGPSLDSEHTFPSTTARALCVIAMPDMRFSVQVLPVS